MIELADNQNEAKIKVIGVGGGGCNALDRMISSGLRGVEFIAANTDAQALQRGKAKKTILLGTGLGAGGNPDVGRKTALESQDEIANELTGTDMVFVTAGMGGGTGTGGAPIIAKIARELGVLTVSVVTKPFHFEGKKRMLQAEQGIRELKEVVDTVIIVPNQRLLAMAEKNTAFFQGTFKMADEVLLHAVQGISEVITKPGLINVDFADVRTVMSERGPVLMGIGVGKGDFAAKDAVNSAICSSLLEDSAARIEGAKGVLFNVSGGTSLTLHQIHEAASIVRDTVHEDANIIFGAIYDEQLVDEVRITIIATGLDKEAAAKKDDHVINFDVSECKRRAEAIGASGKRSFKIRQDEDRDVPAFIRYQAD